jgi:hypothetical protein
MACSAVPPPAPKSPVEEEDRATAAPASAIRLLLHHCIFGLAPRTRRSGHGSENDRSSHGSPLLRPPPVTARRGMRPHMLHALRHQHGFLAWWKW